MFVFILIADRYCTADKGNTNSVNLVYYLVICVLRRL